jgi:DNA processing protein
VSAAARWSITFALSDAETHRQTAPTPEAWAEFLIATLPGMTPERRAMWRATLAAANVTPIAYLDLPAKKREKTAPLPESAADALDKRFSEYRRLTHEGGVGEDLWLIEPGDVGWPRDAMGDLGVEAPERVVGWGNRALLKTSLAGVVGSREAPPEALQIAEILSRSLVELEFGIVSGGARGIDEVAHRTALHSGGSTVFVLPEGLLTSPQFESRADLDPDRVCLVSSVWPFRRWSTPEALARNRVIAALAKALIVVAAENRSGSLMTGMTALALERPTLAVVHEEVTVHSAGNRVLIQRGATALRVSEGHAPNELRSALGLAAAPKPKTGDLFDTAREGDENV